jgi:gluconokinase
MPRPPKILAVGMDCFAMSWLAVDRTGSPISEVFTYADARAAPFAAQVRQELGDAGEKLLWNKTGTPIHTSYALAQHRRLLEEQPAICDSAATFQTLGAHLVGTWTGCGAAMPVSFSEASWTGLLGTTALHSQRLVTGQALAHALPCTRCGWRHALVTAMVI